MKRKLILSILLTCLSLFSLSVKPCSAQNSRKITSEISIVPSNTSPKNDETIYLSTKINSSSDYILTSMTMEIDFDCEVFNFKKIPKVDEHKPYNIKTHCNGNTVTILYTNWNGLHIKANEPIEIFYTAFQVISTTKSPQSVIKAKIKDIYDQNYKSVRSNTQAQAIINIAQPDSLSASLKSLSSSVGALNPNFDPKILEYSMDVPYDVSNIEFNPEPNNLDCTVKVNRSKLNAAGKPTLFKIIVRNKNEKTSLIYTVNVNRAPKPSKPPKERKETNQAKEQKHPKTANNENKNNRNRSSQSSKTKKSNKFPNKEDLDLIKNIDLDENPDNEECEDEDIEFEDDCENDNEENNNADDGYLYNIRIKMNKNSKTNDLDKNKLTTELMFTLIIVISLGLYSVYIFTKHCKNIFSINSITK